MCVTIPPSTNLVSELRFIEESAFQDWNTILQLNNHSEGSEFKKYSARNKLFDAVYFLLQLQGIRKLASQHHLSPPNPSSTPGTGSESQELARLFNMYGSDKSSHHDYHLMYSEYLGERRAQLKKIVEIGIGSIDLLTPQNMGAEGHPGASLRAFRDWAPNATVIGADIDPKTLFVEERIQTCTVDQLNRESFSELRYLIGDGADLVVVDGLHTPRADMNSLLEVLPHLAVGGCFVIEDISPRAAKFLWPMAKVALRSNYRVSLREMKNGFVFIVLSGR